MSTSVTVRLSDDRRFEAFQWLDGGLASPVGTGSRSWALLWRSDWKVTALQVGPGHGQALSRGGRLDEDIFFKSPRRMPQVFGITGEDLVTL